MVNIKNEVIGVRVVPGIRKVLKVAAETGWRSRENRGEITVLKHLRVRNPPIAEVGRVTSIQVLRGPL